MSEGYGVEQFRKGVEALTRLDLCVVQQISLVAAHRSRTIAA